MRCRAFAAMVLFAAAGAAAWAQGPRDEGARLMNELMTGKSPVGGPFTLTDAWGKKKSLEDYRGKVVLLYFGYTTCPDVCPTDLAIIGAALRSLGAEAGEVQPIFVTLDPRRDTARLLRDYVAAFDKRFVALRGSEAAVRKVARSYKVFSRKVPRPDGGYFIDHSAFTFLIDRDGNYRAFLPPGTPADRMAVMVKEAM